MADLADVSTGDIITASRQNDINDYIQDGTHKINTLSIDIGGTELVDSNRYVKPVRVVAPSSAGIPFYASDGTTQTALLDDSGNLHILGRVISL